ncbi:hypothetical protein AAFF_G00035680 [Aldrovandia affinis]|uniref:Uncharacterized protein n=1 Tax=Aldrovandia affinis TaxID=143900 RepID=A0AAD7WFH7_9TELE|nr:hypothetical protein AAFF_G00035680 [Aldrovandia affinis]
MKNTARPTAAVTAVHLSLLKMCPRSPSPHALRRTVAKGDSFTPPAEWHPAQTPSSALSAERRFPAKSLQRLMQVLHQNRPAHYIGYPVPPVKELAISEFNYAYSHKNPTAVAQLQLQYCRRTRQKRNN